MPTLFTALQAHVAKGKTKNLSRPVAPPGGRLLSEMAHAAPCTKTTAPKKRKKSTQRRPRLSLRDRIELVRTARTATSRDCCREQGLHACRPRMLSPKTIVNILETVFAVLRYAKRSGMRTEMVSFSDLTLRAAETPERPYFTSEQVNQIVGAANEPYKTMFALASLMGARAGELLALTVPDLDFERKTIRVNKSADDRTRAVRQPKTKKSAAMLPMPSSLEVLLRNYLKHHWKENSGKLPFPAPIKEGFAYSRNNVVRSGLKPILRKLGIPAENVGLHAFRHGLATELAESEPINVLQAQMPHADVRMTLKVYAHVIPQSQRNSMERIA